MVLMKLSPEQIQQHRENLVEDIRSILLGSDKRASSELSRLLVPIVAHMQQHSDDTV